MINTAIKEDLENPQPYNPGNGKEEAKFYTLTLKS